jgi:hypothetical protein
MSWKLCLLFCYTREISNHWLLTQDVLEVSLGLLMISSLALLRSSVTQIGWTELMQSWNYCWRTGPIWGDQWLRWSLRDLNWCNLKTTAEGQVQYEVINDWGDVTVIECKTLFMSNLKCRPYSLQCHFHELQSLGKSKCVLGSISLKSTWNTLHYHRLRVHYSPNCHFSLQEHPINSWALAYDRVCNQWN